MMKLPGVSLMAIAWLSLASPALAQEEAGVTLEGCRGQATSLDGDLEPITEMSAPGGPGASPSEPLIVDPQGRVDYYGRTDPVITNGTWSLKVFGIPVQRGDEDNSDGETKRAGDVDLDFIPIDVPGLYHVSGSFEGDGGSCSGEGWVKILGSPVGSLPWIAGVGLFGIGLIGVLLARPTSFVVPAPEVEHQAWGPQDPRHPQ